MASRRRARRGRGELAPSPSSTPPEEKQTQVVQTVDMPGAVRVDQGNVELRGDATEDQRVDAGELLALVAALVAEHEAVGLPAHRRGHRLPQRADWRAPHVPPATHREGGPRLLWVEEGVVVGSRAQGQVQRRHVPEHARLIGMTVCTPLPL